MTIRYLKEGKPQSERAEDDAQVRAIVETTLADIEARGDAAIRELSEKFDNYSPASYRLSEAEIQELISEVSERDMADIKFAHDQVRKFAEAQRASMTDIEVEPMPGVILGHKNIPVQSVGCYVPCWQIPNGGICAYVCADSVCGGCAAYCGKNTTVPRQAKSSCGRGNAFRRRA